MKTKLLQVCERFCSFNLGINVSRTNTEPSLCKRLRLILRFKFNEFNGCRLLVGADKKGWLVYPNLNLTRANSGQVLIGILS